MREAILSHVDGIVNYPDPEARALKTAIASFYDVPQKKIVLGNGAAELFYCFFYIVRPKRLLLPVPSNMKGRRVLQVCRSHIFRC